MMKGILHFIFSDLGPWKTWHFSDTKQFTYYTESIAYILKIKFPNQVLCIKDKLLNDRITMYCDETDYITIQVYVDKKSSKW